MSQIIASESYLTTARVVEVIAAGTLIDVPGRQQAETGVAHIWQNVMIQILDLVEHVCMCQHHTLHKDITCLNSAIVAPIKHIMSACECIKVSMDCRC